MNGYLNIQYTYYVGTESDRIPVLRATGWVVNVTV